MRNAAEAAPAEAVTIRFERTTQAEVMHISDRGPGIVEGIDLFEPFQTSKSDGSGLGPAVSRALARAHGGDLTSAANPTTFVLTLPRASEGAAA